MRDQRAVPDKSRAIDTAALAFRPIRKIGPGRNFFCIFLLAQSLAFRQFPQLLQFDRLVQYYAV